MRYWRGCHKMLTTYHKEILKSVVPSVAFIIIFFTVYAFIPGKNFVTLLSLVLSLALGARLLGDIRCKNKPVFKDYIKNIVTITIVLALFSWMGVWLGPYGWVGASVIILVYVFYRLFRKRKHYVQGMRVIEEQLFGKTLDKENWEGKDKPVFPKIRWR